MELSSWEEWVLVVVGRIGGVERIEGLIQRSKLWMWRFLRREHGAGMSVVENVMKMRLWWRIWMKE
jgi:hypothetical protein